MIGDETNIQAISLGFVFIYFLIYMRSILLAAVSISLIIFSVPVTVVITTQVMGIEYSVIFSDLELVLFYVILGIGSNNIFVFHDAWL